LELLVRAQAALGEDEAAGAALEELDAIVVRVVTEPLRASVSFTAGTPTSGAARRSREPGRVELARVLARQGGAVDAVREAAAAPCGGPVPSTL
jgi:hypothetical protein